MAAETMGDGQASAQKATLDHMGNPVYGLDAELKVAITTFWAITSFGP